MAPARIWPARTWRARFCLSTLGIGGCAGHDPGPTAETIDALEIIATPAPLAPAVLQVVWTPPPETTSWVEFGPVSGDSSRADGAGEALLMGLPEDTEASFHVVVEEADGSRWTSAEVLYEVPSAPSDVPRFEVTRDEGEAWGEHILLAVVYNTAHDGVHNGLIVLDRDGRIVWWTAHGQDELRTARLAASGEGIVYLRDMGTEVEAPGVHQIGWDGERTQHWPSALAHHDFVEVDEDTVAFVEYDPRTYEEMEVVGDRIVEVDSDGSRTEVWSTWDDLPPSTTNEWEDAHFPDAVDWTHANGVALDQENGIYLLSLYWTEQIVFVDRDAGALTHTLGGATSDWTPMAESTFGPQHAPVVRSGGLWLFDNGMEHAGPSRIMSLDLTTAEARLDLDWFQDPDKTMTPVEGDVFVTDDGFVYASFGMLGTLGLLSPEGQPTWEALALDAVVLGRGQPF